MKYLFCVTGYSGSGKDTFISYLSKVSDIPVIKTVSTRPQRNADENSTTECISEYEFSEYEANGELLEVREYHPKTATGEVWKYATPSLDHVMTTDFAIMATSFDQLRNIFEYACDPYNKVEYQIIPIVLDVYKSLLLYRTMERAYGDFYDFKEDIHNDNFDKLHKLDKKVPEVASRFIRDLEEQKGIENFPTAFKRTNNTKEQLYKSIYLTLADINMIKNSGFEEFVHSKNYYSITDYKQNLHMVICGTGYEPTITASSNNLKK